VKNYFESHSVTAQSKWFFLQRNSEKKFEIWKKIDIVIGKNYSFKRDNFKPDIPLGGKLNKANYCSLVH